MIVFNSYFQISTEFEPVASLILALGCYQMIYETNAIGTVVIFKEWRATHKISSVYN